MSSEKYYITFIMDASGSMASMGDEPWQGLNNFIKKQKESKVDFNFTLIFFNSEINFIYKNLESNKIPELTSKDYVPMDTTSLYDAIGKGIEYHKTDSMDNVIFVILTDGHENSSQEYNKKGIQNMIKDLESKNKWQFVYLGANQDSFEVGNGMGINNTCNYAYTPEAFRGVMRNISNSISRQISGETTEIKLEKKEKKENDKDLPQINFENKKFRSLKPPNIRTYSSLPTDLKPNNLEQTVFEKFT
jgi:hypothetical protein